MKRLGWGILGAAKIAREWVAPAMQAAEHATLVAVASLTPGKAEALAGRYTDVAVHGDYDALLADAAVDAVYIALPNNLHVHWTLRALAAGKHVLTEKPVALVAEEIDRLIAARDASGCFAAEAFMVTHHPQWHRVRALIREGAIGRLRHVQGAFTYFNDDPANIRNDAALAGGALRDIGVYPAVVTRFVTGTEPVAVQSRIEWDRGIDATARVWADFPDFTLDSYVSMRMHPYQQMHFHGDKGWIKVLTPFNAKAYGDDALEIRGADGHVRIERFALVDQYVCQLDAFAATVLTGAPYDCPLEFSRGNQVMIDMIYAAGEKF